MNIVTSNAGLVRVMNYQPHTEPRVIIVSISQQMAQADMLPGEQLSTINHDEKYRRRRVTVGGTQIGFSGLGQGSALLTFPGNFSIGEALRSPHWARFSTSEELVADPTQKLRTIEAVEKPNLLIYEDGSKAYDCQCIGLQGFVMHAVIAQNCTPAPIVHRPCHDLKGVRTPPTPESELDELEFEWHTEPLTEDMP